MEHEVPDDDDASDNETRVMVHVYLIDNSLVDIVELGRALKHDFDVFPIQIVDQHIPSCPLSVLDLQSLHLMLLYCIIIMINMKIIFSLNDKKINKYYFH